MELEIPIKGGNYKYIVDNFNKNCIETTELKYTILKNKFTDVGNLSKDEQTFYIEYLFNIFDYLPYTDNTEANLKILIHHLEDCYYNNNFEYNKNRLLEQSGIDNLTKNVLIHLLSQFDNKKYDDMEIEELKLKLVNKLDTMKNEEIVFNIHNYECPDYTKCENEINKLNKSTNLEYIEDIYVDTNIIPKLIPFIEYIIKLNNIYKNYLIDLEKYKINIISELYKIKLK